MKNWYPISDPQRIKKRKEYEPCDHSGLCVEVVSGPGYCNSESKWSAESSQTKMSRWRSTLHEVKGANVSQQGNTQNKPENCV